VKTKGKKTRRVPRKVLNEIDEALREIEAHFDLVGFGEPKSESVSDTNGENTDRDVEPEEGEGELDLEPEEDEFIDEEEEFTPHGKFSFEEVEVLIDLFISQLVQSGVISRENASSLAEVFGHIFGWDHEITQYAQAFEEEIKDYFGSIEYENMLAAYTSLTEIRTILNQEMERSAAK
jgi:hypothetical protein